jgi:uncharacterized protein YdeI (YjbR/CyaY-like superfamily)
MAPVVPDPKKIKAFKDEAAFEAWLRVNHARATEIWLRIYKKGSQRPTITLAQALDVVLCWGWIDGVRKPFDDESFLQRYTPRRARSIWSQNNQEHVARLTKAGRMQPSGHTQIEAAKADGRWHNAYAPMRHASAATILTIFARPSPPILAHSRRSTRSIVRIFSHSPFARTT